MKKIALGLGSIVITLVVVELLLRLTGLGVVRPQVQFDPHTAERLDVGVFVGDPDIFWREPSDPASAATRPGKFIRVGDPVPAKGSKFRVIILGDSCSRLSGGNQPYSMVLEGMLDPRRAEVFNASLPGYTSHQGLAWLRKQVLAYEPDLVIIYFGWNDHWRSTGTTDKEYAASLAQGRLRLLNLFRQRPAPPPLRVSAEDYRANLLEMASLVRGAGGQSWVVLAPHNINDDNLPFYRQNGNITRRDDPQQLHDTYLAVARQAAGSAVVDLARVFSGIDAMPILLMRDGIHPTDPGHMVIARVLADRVEHEIFRQPGETPEPVVSGLAELANRLFGEGRLEIAAATYRRAVQAEPGFLKARLGLAWLLATCGDEAVRNGPAARELLDPIRAEQADSVNFLFIAAGAEAECGAFEAAVEKLDRALVILKKQNQAGSSFGRTVVAARQKFLRGEPYRTHTSQDATHSN